ncbi:MAG: GTP-binding protein [Eggerthellaceae bacterium]|nr:GTP-binding protein [Eggerthellaceae bacterium]
MSEVKIAMITGYLGAGKTTLLNRVLANTEGIRAAVIVNDIGEVNIDADLVARAGQLVELDDVVAMTNGCICCTLAEDLAEQLRRIANGGEFDYIVIEASGICEPIPIAYTISDLVETAGPDDVDLVLDNIVSVVDSARMLEEFDGGRALVADDIDEDDVESLLVQQIEFCTTLILNKADLVTPEQMGELRAIVRSLQKDAVIVEATQAEVPLAEIMDTGRFNFFDAYNSAVWADAMAHPEEHENPEVLEYGFSTFVYQRRKPLDLQAFGQFVANWPDEIVRCKGIVWKADTPDDRYLFEQAGRHFYLSENGMFTAAEEPEVREAILADFPGLLEDWDDELGDRMVKLVFIGRHMDRADIESRLDACLVQ